MNGSIPQGGHIREHKTNRHARLYHFSDKGAITYWSQVEKVWCASANTFRSNEQFFDDTKPCNTARAKELMKYEI